MRDRPSYTAELVAFARAAETRRTPQRRVLDDPLAKGFLSPHLRGTFGLWERAGRLGQRLEDLFPGLIAYVAARHRFIDEVVLKSGAEGVDQVVLLGAGYDSRPWRFQEKLGAARGFEIDHPATSARKSRVLGRRASLTPRGAGAATPPTSASRPSTRSSTGSGSPPGSVPLGSGRA